MMLQFPKNKKKATSTFSFASVTFVALRTSLTMKVVSICFVGESGSPSWFDQLLQKYLLVKCHSPADHVEYLKSLTDSQDETVNERLRASSILSRGEFLQVQSTELKALVSFFGEKSSFLFRKFYCPTFPERSQYKKEASTISLSKTVHFQECMVLSHTQR